MNSISILRRQEKAAKLNECYCDGPDDHECIDIQRNMQELCFDRANKRHKSKSSSTSSSSSNSSSTSSAEVAVNGDDRGGGGGGGWSDHDRRDPSNNANSEEANRGRNTQRTRPGGDRVGSRVASIHQSVFSPSLVIILSAAASGLVLTLPSPVN